MKKIKHLLILVCIAGCAAACKKDDAPAFDELGQFKADTTAIRQFVVENNIDAEKDDSGIFYQIIVPGEGENIDALSSVTADYEGRFLNGNIFDSSNGTPVTFPLRETITGWQIGLPHIKNGGTIRLILPSFYGYRNIPNSRIPANSILDFTIKVTDVN